MNTILSFWQGFVEGANCSILGSVLVKNPEANPWGKNLNFGWVGFYVFPVAISLFPDVI